MGGGHNSANWSVELCGGTHVKRTGDIGLISVVAESAVAAGVRRIEALTGHAARHAANATIRTAKQAAAELRTSIDDLPGRVSALLDERKKMERDLTEARKKLAMTGGGAASEASPIEDIKGVKLFRLAVSIDMKDLKALADEGRAKVGSGVVAIANNGADGKGGIVVAVTKDLTDRFNAVDLVRIGSEALGGKGGGGRPDMAQAGGPDGTKAQAALDAIAAAMGNA
jgi:alanyl-tRNA synthetase